MVFLYILREKGGWILENWNNHFPPQAIYRLRIMLRMRDKKPKKTVSSKNKKMELPYSSNCTIPALYKSWIGWIEWFDLIRDLGQELEPWVWSVCSPSYNNNNPLVSTVSQPISRSISQYNLSVSTVSQMQSVHPISHYNHPIISTNQSVQSVSTVCTANQSVVRSVNQ